MKLRRVFIVILTLAMMIAAMPGITSAAADSYNYRGKYSYSYASHTEGCVTTSMYVAAGEAMYRVDGAPEPASGAMVTFARYDACTQTLLDLLVGSVADLPADAFKIDNGLNSASLEATITAHDYTSNTSKTMTVIADWTGEGSVARGTSNYHYHSEGFNVTGHFNGSSRFASSAITILDEAGSTLADASGNGQMGISNGGSVYVEH